MGHVFHFHFAAIKYSTAWIAPTRKTAQKFANLKSGGVRGTVSAFPYSLNVTASRSVLTALMNGAVFQLATTNSGGALTGRAYRLSHAAIMRMIAWTVPTSKTAQKFAGLESGGARLMAPAFLCSVNVTASRTVLMALMNAAVFQSVGRGSGSAGTCIVSQNLSVVMD